MVLRLVEADVADGDTISFRLTHAGGVLDNYAVTGTATVSKTAGGGSTPGLGFIPI